MLVKFCCDHMLPSLDHFKDPKTSNFQINMR